MGDPHQIITDLFRVQPLSIHIINRIMFYRQVYTVIAGSLASQVTKKIYY